MSKKKDTGWRKRNNPNAPNYGQAFHLEPHGHRSDLPVALRQVSFSDIADALKRREDKNKTEEEREADELIDAAIREELEKEMEVERKKDILLKINEYADKQDEKRRMKKVLQETKAEQKGNESEEDADGYEGYASRVEDGKRRIDEPNQDNEVFG
jgi:hypothetical protein